MLTSTEGVESREQGDPGYMDQVARLGAADLQVQLEHPGVGPRSEAPREGPGAALSVPQACLDSHRGPGPGHPRSSRAGLDPPGPISGEIADPLRGPTRRHQLAVDQDPIVAEPLAALAEPQAARPEILGGPPALTPHRHRRAGGKQKAGDWLDIDPLERERPRRARGVDPQACARAQGRQADRVVVPGPVRVHLEPRAWACPPGHHGGDLPGTVAGGAHPPSHQHGDRAGGGDRRRDQMGIRPAHPGLKARGCDLEVGDVTTGRPSLARAQQRRGDGAGQGCPLGWAGQSGRAQRGSGRCRGRSARQRHRRGRLIGRRHLWRPRKGRLRRRAAAGLACFPQLLDPLAQVDDVGVGLGVALEQPLELGLQGSAIRVRCPGCAGPEQGGEDRDQGPPSPRAPPDPGGAGTAAGLGIRQGWARASWPG